MRIPINLASEPFRRDRPLVAAFGRGGCDAGRPARHADLSGGIGSGLAQPKRAQAIAQNGNPAEDDAHENERSLEGVLRQQQNAEVLDRSVFLNALLVAQRCELDAHFFGSGKGNSCTTCG